jgi:DNA-binding CsgD family transcriptional regulator
MFRDRHRTRAAETLAEAHARFKEMGALLWEARAAEELERASPGRGAGQLTATERRIAACVAEGMRNQEIAQTLFMGVATVEGHLTRIYRKLGIRSRSELARGVADGSVQVSDA